MARSITFVIEGDEDTQITITEQDDGTLLFEIEVLYPSEDSDLRALYFDFNDDSLISGLSVTTGDDVTNFHAKYDSINDLGHGTSIKGEVGNKYGAFDVGVALGTPGAGNDTIQSTSFVLDHDTIDLTLDDLDLADFGLRINGEKLGAESTEAITAEDDAFDVDEGAVSSGDNVLTNDDPINGLMVTDAEDGGPDLSLGANNVTTDGGRSGVLTILADGTATFELTSGFDTLNDGDIDTYTFTYSTVNDDG